MNLIDVYEQHQQDLERFKVLRDKVWRQVLDDNEKLAASFGGKEHLNEDAKKLYDSRINSFNAEWSADGSRFKDMTSQHQKQINQITGSKEQAINQIATQDKSKSIAPENTTKGQFQNQSQKMTVSKQQTSENEEDKKKEIREKIARQQAAINARKNVKKRSR